VGLVVETKERPAFLPESLAAALDQALPLSERDLQCSFSAGPPASPAGTLIDPKLNLCGVSFPKSDAAVLLGVHEIFPFLRFGCDGQVDQDLARTIFGPRACRPFINSGAHTPRATPDLDQRLEFEAAECSAACGWLNIGRVELIEVGNIDLSPSTRKISPGFAAV